MDRFDLVVLHTVLSALSATRFAAGVDSFSTGSVSGALAAPAGDRSIQLKYRLAEEQPRGTFVGNVLVDAQLSSRFPLDILRHIRFRFLTDAHPMLSVDPLSGVITTNDVIDRDAENLCRQRELCEINVDVVLQPVQYFQVIKVGVQILDINDNAPTFIDSNVVIGIIESAQVGSVYVVQGAVDWDSPVFGIQNYELDSSSNKFRLHFNTKVDGSQEVRLILKEKLDREVESRYILKLTAFDGGPSPRTGTATITINVLDSNDNKPKFVGGPTFEVNVLENTAPGTVIIKLQAVDPDEGPNGLVEYSLAGSTISSPAGQTFTVRNSTGEVVVRGLIDHEKTVIYSLVVVASDHGHDPLSSEATVVIRVEDQNDNPPSLSIRTLTGTTTAEIPESAPVGTFVAHVTVVDHDSGANGRVNCSVSHPNVFVLVQKYATEYQLLTAMALDRERVAQYGLLVKCQDGGGTGSRSGAGSARVSRVTEKQLQVNVLDVNDNAPMFSQRTYQGTIFENNYVGATVLQVSASDLDQGDNAMIQYIIHGHMSSFFQVDQRGLITAVVQINREEQPDRYTFPIVAMDAGSPAMSGSATVIIFVEDLNDEKPIFLQKSYQFSVYENELEHVKVGIVTAEDKDGPKHNVVGYSFVPGNTAADSFDLDQVNGVITAKTTLDREIQSVYYVIVRAYDKLAPTFSSTVTATIQVLDKNDNEPQFLFPNEKNNTVSISSYTPKDHVIAVVTARDIDAGDNARISYSIINDKDNVAVIGSTTGSSAFRINSDNGMVTVNAPLDKIEQRTFRLNVKAIDHGKPARHHSAILNVVVNRSIPFGLPMKTPRSTSSAFLSRNSIIFVLALVSAGGFLLLVAVVTACALRRHRNSKRRSRHGNARRNNQRNEALRGLTSLAPASSPTASPSKQTEALTNGGIDHQPDFDHVTVNGKAAFITSRLPDDVDVSYRPLNDVIDGGNDVTASDSRRERYVPPPPPPPRGGLFWRQQQQQTRHNGDLYSGGEPDYANTSLQSHTLNSVSTRERTVNSSYGTTGAPAATRYHGDQVYHIAGGASDVDDRTLTNGVRQHHEVIV